MNDKKIKSFLKIVDEYSKSKGIKAAAALPIQASPMARKTAYEIAKNEAYNKALRKAGYTSPLKSGEVPMTRKRKLGQ